MKSAVEQLAAYKSVHLNPKNIRTHFFGVPMIIWSAFLMLGTNSPISPAPIARIIPNPPNNTGINSGEFYFDGTYSSTSDGSNLSYNAYNFTWITAGDSIRNRPPTPDYITYQYQQGPPTWHYSASSRTNMLSTTRYSLPLRVELLRLF